MSESPELLPVTEKKSSCGCHEHGDERLTLDARAIPHRLRHAAVMSKPASSGHSSARISAASIRESLVKRTSAPCEAHRYQLRPAATIPCGSTTSCVVILDL